MAVPPWAVPAISLAALSVVAGAAFAPAACAATPRAAPSRASVPAFVTASRPAITIPPLGQPQPQLGASHPALGESHALLGTRSKSPNWSGYDVTGGPFTSVTAAWTQPRVRSSSLFLTDVAFWVGLDGDSPDPINDPPQTVEQIGTEGFSFLGRVYYDAWYEMYPAAPVFLSNKTMAIHAGDRVTAGVTWAPATPAGDSTPATPGSFTLTLVNHTTDKTFTVTEPVEKTGVAPERSSVEVVAEAPSLADGSLLPVANFGLVRFSGCAFEGQPIAAFDWSRIDMISLDTQATQAATSALNPDDGSFTVTTDFKRPTTTVAGAGAAWHSKPVTLHFSATDNRGGTGVAYTQYSRDGGKTWTKGTSVTLPAPADHSADGATTVWYRSTDRAGNLEKKRTCTVRIDTRQPIPVAKWPARALRGRRAALRFYVSDPRPGSPTATVTLRFIDAHGALVKKVVLPGCRVGTTLTHGFVCRLAKGSYRVIVTATDAAGNAARTVAITDLLVR